MISCILCQQFKDSEGGWIAAYSEDCFIWFSTSWTVNSFLEIFKDKKRIIKEKDTVMLGLQNSLDETKSYF